MERIQTCNPPPHIIPTIGLAVRVWIDWSIQSSVRLHSPASKYIWSAFLTAGWSTVQSCRFQRARWSATRDTTVRLQSRDGQSHCYSLLCVYIRRKGTGTGSMYCVPGITPELLLVSLRSVEWQMKKLLGFCRAGKGSDVLQGAMRMCLKMLYKSRKIRQDGTHYTR